MDFDEENIRNEAAIKLENAEQVSLKKVWEN